MTAAMATFKIPATEATIIADQFAGAIASSPATMERMGDAFKYAGPAAAGFGISLEKTVAEVAAFHQVGLRGEMAGTAFRMALIQLSDEATKSGSVAGAALKGWDASTEGITGAVKRLNDAGVDTVTVIQELGARAGPGMAALMKMGDDAMDELAGKIKDSADVAKMYETQMNTLGGRFAIFKSAVQDIYLELFTKLEPALSAIAKRAAELADAFGELIKAVFAGDWAKVKTMMTDAFDSAIESARNAITAIKDFGTQVLETLGLTKTISSIKKLFANLRTTVQNLSTTAKTAFDKLGDVKWADVLSTAMEVLDTALSTAIEAISGIINAAERLVTWWRNLSDETKTVIKFMTGAVGLIVAAALLDAAMIKTIAVIGTYITALIAKTATLMGTTAAQMSFTAAVAAYPVAAFAAVAAAAAVGVGLGLLIRKIPGVSEAMDGLAERTMKLLGLFEEEDTSLAARNARYRAQREAMTDADRATARAAAETLHYGAALTDEQRAASEALETTAALTEEMKAAVAAADAIAAAAASAAAGLTKVSDATKVITDTTGKASDNLTTVVKPIEEIGEAADKTSKDADKMVRSLGDFTLKKLTPFDISAFTMGIKQLGMSLAGIDMPKIDLPDFSAFKIPRISRHDVSNFGTILRYLNTMLQGMDISALAKLKLPEFKLPDITKASVKTFLGALGDLKDGIMGLDFGELGRMDINIKGGGDDKLGEILGLMKGMKGVIWA